MHPPVCRGEDHVVPDQRAAAEVLPSGRDTQRHYVRVAPLQPTTPEPGLSECGPHSGHLIIPVPAQRVAVGCNSTVGAVMIRATTICLPRMEAACVLNMGN